MYVIQMIKLQPIKGHHSPLHLNSTIIATRRRLT